jgi:A/G-specific adenine glycosylase
VIFGAMKANFTKKLLFWNKKLNFRQMPWKGEKDPYKIWLSEIILQQTRVEQGWAYYEKFIKAFPTVHHLAKAPEEMVFKLWEGLGYYTRCKNLIATARYISANYKGIFPNTYEDIIQLKGIGPYTAAAIASFAFNLPYAVVDGNVFRVLSRYFGISSAIDSNEGKKIFSQLANELLHQELPGLYNQAIMDFGAVVCKPQQPNCTACLLRKDCIAFQKKLVETLPVKEKKLQKQTRWFHYFVVKADKEVLISKRTGKGIWENLHEFVLYESKAPMPADIKKYTQFFKKKWKVTNCSVKLVSEEFRQQLTHQTIVGRFIEIEVNKTSMPVVEGYNWVKIGQLKLLAFPRMLTAYLGKEAKN